MDELTVRQIGQGVDKLGNVEGDGIVLFAEAVLSLKKRGQQLV